MSHSLILGEKILSLLDQSVLTTTYKPALLLAIIDCTPERADERIPVRSLAERVIELYWPQTLSYPTTGRVLQQGGEQAKIVRDIADFRGSRSATLRSLPESLRGDRSWSRLVDRVEKTLAEYPIPRLQRPFDDFLYEFDWPSGIGGNWSVREYGESSRELVLMPGVGEALTSLGPLLRPFITRLWTDKAAKLNPEVEAARSLVEFEEFMFGRDRVALERIGEGLLDFQRGRCFYCGTSLAEKREIDHFIPWNHSGDNGLDNLVGACPLCNSEKRATLPGPEHVSALMERNSNWDADMMGLADERRWPRNRSRSASIARAAYDLSPDERPLWIWGGGKGRIESLGIHRSRLEDILGRGNPGR